MLRSLLITSHPDPGMDSDQMHCLVHGWVPVSGLKAAWEHTTFSAALREARADIDDLIEDAWGPESGLKFWNTASGVYSHAASWEELAKEISGEN